MAPLSLDNLNILISKFFRRRFPKSILRNGIADIADKICNDDSKENIDKLQSINDQIDVTIFKELKQYIDALKIEMFGVDGLDMKVFIKNHERKYIMFFVYKKNYTSDIMLGDDKNIKFTIVNYIPNSYYELISLLENRYMDYIAYF